MSAPSQGGNAHDQLIETTKEAFVELDHLLDTHLGLLRTLNRVTDNVVVHTAIKNDPEMMKVIQSIKEKNDILQNKNHKFWKY